jgi:hypothetical protein
MGTVIDRTEKADTPLRGAGSNALLGLIKPSAMPVVLTYLIGRKGNTKNLISNLLQLCSGRHFAWETPRVLVEFEASFPLFVNKSEELCPDQHTFVTP